MSTPNIRIEMPLNQIETILMFCRTTIFLDDNPNLNQKELKEILQSDQPDEAKVDLLLGLVDDLEDQLDNSDLPLLYQIISDNEGGSSAGPWDSSVYGTSSLWLPNVSDHSPEIPGFFKFSSIDFDDAFFDDYFSAQNWAEDHAHEVILEVVDNFNAKPSG